MENNLSSNGEYPKKMWVWDDNPMFKVLQVVYGKCLINDKWRYIHKCCFEGELAFSDNAQESFTCPYEDGEIILVRDSEDDTWKIDTATGIIDSYTGEVTCHSNCDKHWKFHAKVNADNFFALAA